MGSFIRTCAVLGMGAILLSGSADAEAQQIGAKAQNDRAGRNLPARDVLDQRERGIERTDRTRSAQVDNADIASAADADGSGFYRATDVIGMTIQVEGNTNVGVVKDIVLDSVTNEVAYFLVDSSTTLKADGMLVIPYAAVQGPIFVDGRPARSIRLNYGVDRLRGAPTLTRAGLRTLRGSDFFFTVNKFYGIERTRRGFRAGDRDRDGRDRDGRERDGRDRDGRDRDGDRTRNRDGDRNRDVDSDRPRRPADRGNDPKARPRGDRDNDRPQTRPGDKKQSTPRADRDKPKVRPETVKPKTERPKIDVPKTEDRPNLPKKGGVNIPKDVKPKNIKKGVKGLLDPK